MAAGGLWLGRRLDRLYVGVVERELVKHVDRTPLLMTSETAWTILDLPSISADRSRAPSPTGASSELAPPRTTDARLRTLEHLRSGDRRRVEGALRSISKPDSLIVVQAVQLLAWDDVVASARKVLEQVASSHIGLLVDALLDPETDFAIRRRIPRVLGTVHSQRALDGLALGLEDVRFEVRYQCGRAIDRLLQKNRGFTVDPERVMAVIDRGLSVPPQVWAGHRLIDGVEVEDDSVGAGVVPARLHRNLEHVFSLLAAVLPREPTSVALRGIESHDPALRGLALEYLDSVLSPTIRAKLAEVMKER
jgi:hypothetical protein